MRLQCNPRDLSSLPRTRVRYYLDVDDIAETMAADYFSTCAEFLKPGDAIEVWSVAGDRPAFEEFLVIAVDVAEKSVTALPREACRFGSTSSKRSTKPTRKTAPKSAPKRAQRNSDATGG